MSDYITDQQLLIEAARRSRKKKGELKAGGYEGAPFQKVVEALVPGLMDAKAFDAAFRALLQTGAILVTSRVTVYKGDNAKDRVHHPLTLLQSLHPDVMYTEEWRYFTHPGNSPFTRRRNKDGWAVIKYSYWVLKLKHIYIVEDGLPKFVEKMLEK